MLKFSGFADLTSCLEREAAERAAMKIGTLAQQSHLEELEDTHSKETVAHSIHALYASSQKGDAQTLAQRLAYEKQA